MDTEHHSKTTKKKEHAVNEHKKHSAKQSTKNRVHSLDNDINPIAGRSIDRSTNNKIYFWAKKQIQITAHDPPQTFIHSVGGGAVGRRQIV